MMPVVTFDRETHTYRVDGRVVMYVSGILDAAGLGVDYSRVPPATLQHAKQRGDYVDACCHLFDVDDLDWDSVHAEALPYVRAWQRFRERERFQTVVSQAVVYHAELDYAGTADSYGLIDKAPTIAERKCTSKLADTYSLQTAAYAMPGIGIATDETAGELLTLTVARRLIVQLRPDATYRMVDCEVEAKKAGRDDFEAFRGAVAVAKWRGTQNGNGTR